MGVKVQPSWLGGESHVTRRQADTTCQCPILSNCRPCLVCLLYKLQSLQQSSSDITHILQRREVLPWVDDNALQLSLLLLQIAAAEAGQNAARQESETNHRFVAHAKWWVFAPRGMSALIAAAV